ncbi:MAG: hypothetical protein WAL56_05985 [Candidatus Sulfotelmatobacter sp.]
MAGIIPGTVVLLIFGWLRWFFALGFLGYRTKVSLVVLVAFVIDFTATTFLNSILGGVGGAIGGVSYKPPHSYDIAPWRGPRWRELIRGRVGAGCPNDTRPLSPIIVDLRIKIAANLPPEQQQDAITALHLEKLAAESDDLNWAVWYDHYHKIILEPRRDVVWHVHTGLAFSLETAALIVVLCATVVPSVRHWWCILPSCMWVFLFVLEQVFTLKKALDRWSTLNDQVKYLSADPQSREADR